MELLPNPAVSERVSAASVESPGSHAEGAPFTCPRCQLMVTARFYGPCDTCRTYLRTTLGGEARVIEVAEYEPKMNVTPNAVALKDE